MRWVFVVSALAIVGCSKGPGAEKEYRIVSGNGDATATCAASRKTAQAYLADKNAAKYRQWSKTADQDCAVARLLAR
jgi:serine protease inhibitor ecotin